MMNKSLGTNGTNYRTNGIASEDSFPIDSKMQISSLSDICNLVTDGTHDTPKTLKSGVSFIKAKEITGGIIDFENCEYISYEDHLKVIARSNPKKGDILFAHIGASLGEAAFIKTNKEFSIKNVALFKPNPSKIDNRYLFYYIIGPKFQNEIKNCRTGSAQPFVSLDILRKHLIEYHTNLETQRKIASILSAYDDLIENNTRRIKILEEMAQALYREWFVKFRFPGHEKVKMVESELGMVPEGWEVKILGDLAQQMRRSINPDQINPETPYIGLEHIPRKSIALFEWGKASEVKSTKLAFKRGEILFGKIRPYFHKVVVAPIEGVCSSDTIVISSKASDYYSIVLACVSSEEFVNHATQTSQGTKMPRAEWNVLIKYPVIIPPLSILSCFSQFMQDIVNQIQKMIFRNRNLIRTRDLLLPKLISGEVDVENIDIGIKENVSERT